MATGLIDRLRDAAELRVPERTRENLCMEAAGAMDEATAELTHLRAVIAALVAVLKIAHDEIHHPGAAAHRGEDVELMVRAALEAAK